ncbi:lycopene cyclase family protein [Mucilaginibacter sp. CSA2-8R]|uniref:lycopene cyclase family protein n=1 Tax=Mucilaginibacter sp. CSA2-8R TaxID=3141542 RepID=UPI00315D5908
MKASDYSSSFDIVIVGAGCAGLQLLYQFFQLAAWPNLKVLLIDDGSIKQRSWCFWSSGPHPLQHMVAKFWQNLLFSSMAFSKAQVISPYSNHISRVRYFLTTSVMSLFLYTTTSL